MENSYQIGEKLLKEAALLPNKPKLLLHACCAPCSTYPLDKLKDLFDITLFYNNSNIYPFNEYDRRLNELIKFLEVFNKEYNVDIKLIVPEYKNDEFNKRLEYKALNNPLQELYKLIMNSCYGKTIQKPVKYEHKYIKESDLSKYWYKNYYKIIECSKLANSNIYDVKIIKQINDQFNFTLLGVQVLSMSKRIMNEVMCLAFDLGIKIFYQDTDSMHIPAR